VLHSESQVPDAAGAGAQPAPAQPVPARSARPAAPASQTPADHPASFAEWMSSALRREGMTQEAAARQLGVSVKTVSRWVGGATQPRMRDLKRIQEVFGEVPLH
jgi:DNA-binding XRE family transcriptional regulator